MLYNYKIIAWLFSAMMLMTGVCLFVRYLFTTDKKQAYDVAARIKVRDPTLTSVVDRYIQRGESKVLTWKEVHTALVGMDKWMDT